MFWSFSSRSALSMLKRGSLFLCYWCPATRERREAGVDGDININLCPHSSSQCLMGTRERSERIAILWPSVVVPVFLMTPEPLREIWICCVKRDSVRALLTSDLSFGSLKWVTHFIRLSISLVLKNNLCCPFSAGRAKICTYGKSSLLLSVLDGHCWHGVLISWSLLWLITQRAVMEACWLRQFLQWWTFSVSVVSWCSAVLPRIQHSCLGMAAIQWGLHHSLEGIKSAYPSGRPEGCTWLECDQPPFCSSLVYLCTVTPGARFDYRSSDFMKDWLWKYNSCFLLICDCGASSCSWLCFINSWGTPKATDIVVDSVHWLEVFFHSQIGISIYLKRSGPRIILYVFVWSKSTPQPRGEYETRYFTSNLCLTCRLENVVSIPEWHLQG